MGVQPPSSATKEGSVAALGKGRRVTGAERGKLADDLKKRYESGSSIRALAESTGRSGMSGRRLMRAAPTPDQV